MSDLPWLPEVLYGGPIEIGMQLTARCVGRSARLGGSNEGPATHPTNWSLDGFFFRSIEQIVRQALDEEGRQDVSFEISFYGGTDGPDEHGRRANMAAAAIGDSRGAIPGGPSAAANSSERAVSPWWERLGWWYPDAGCHTLPNGDCVSEGPCMHSAPDAERLPGEIVTYHFGPSDAERIADKLRLSVTKGSLPSDELVLMAADALEQVQAREQTIVAQLRDAEAFAEEKQAFHGTEMAALEDALSEAREEIATLNEVCNNRFTAEVYAEAIQRAERAEHLRDLACEELKREMAKVDGLKERAEKAEANNAQLHATCVAESKRMAALMERAEKAEANTEKEVHDRISEYIASMEALQVKLSEAQETIAQAGKVTLKVHAERDSAYADLRKVQRECVEQRQRAANAEETLVWERSQTELALVERNDALATIANQFRPQIERMQKALRQIANAPDSFHSAKWSGGIARAALKGQTEEQKE